MLVKPAIRPHVRDLVSLRRHLSALATLPVSEAPVLSIFLDLRSPLESQHSAFLSWTTSVRATLTGPQRPLLDEARAEVDMVFRQSWPENVDGLAIFVRAGSAPLLMVLPFAAHLETAFHAAPMPAIFPLVQMKDRFHRFVVAISSEESSRIFEVTLGAISEQILTVRPEMRQRVGREWTREHYHQRKREHDKRFLKDQAAVIASLMAKRGLNHLILAGQPRAVGALRAALPKELQSRVADSIFRSPRGHDCSEVLEEAIATFIEVEQQESRGTVELLHDRVRRDGLAVVGIHPCREAILSGAASELVISEELPAEDREELVRLATTRELPIEVCEGDELLASHGGVGCLLRYRPGVSAA
jgi:protein required for attachment to host cells